MREKKLWLVITFHTTAAAIAMEKLCRAKGLPGRLIPVPRELTADCGKQKDWRLMTFMSCCCEEHEKRDAAASLFILSAASSVRASRACSAQ